MKKVALITGGARGIGMACAQKFADNGFRIAIVYNGSVEAACELVNKLNSSGELNAVAFKANVANSIEVNKAVEQTVKVFGRIDIVVNNAGISLSKILMDTSNEEWRKIMSTDLDGAFYVSRAALPYMLDSGGAIVNVSSIWGIRGAASETAYSAAKAGLIGLSKALAKELAYNGIRVNCVAPGVTDTDMMKDYTDSEIGDILERIPSRRMAKAREIADAIYFMAVTEYITGEVLEIDGGFE